MTEGFALTKEERQTLFDSLSKALEASELSLNEFVFAASDLIKTTFWISLTANLSEEEVNQMRERLTNSVNETISVLENNTDNVAEDMIVLSTVMLEAVNHVLSQQLEEVSVDE